MKREIKFRVWVGDKMIDPKRPFEGAGSGSKEYAILMYGTPVLFSVLGFEPSETIVAEIMQFTGLKDKNGNDIYEGDILETTYEDKGEESGFGKDKTTVSFESGCFGWVGSVTKKLNAFESIDDMKEWIIVGNIYENKELLNS